MDEDRGRGKPRDEAPGDADREAEDGGSSYTARPSRERPEEGGRTRREEDERPDSPEGREKA